MDISKDMYLVFESLGDIFVDSLAWHLNPRVTFDGEPTGTIDYVVRIPANTAKEIISNMWMDGDIHETLSPDEVRAEAIAIVEQEGYFLFGNIDAF